jgi:YkoY family integral membrane protein
MPIADMQTALEFVSQNWSLFLADAGMVIVSLVLIEGLLSVDNALGIAAMASHLPKHQQKAALRWGLIGAYLFRGIALALVSWLMHNEWVKWFGAIYLIYLACDHLQFKKNVHEESAASAAAKTAGKGFIATICSIELMDLSLSLDNV